MFALVFSVTTTTLLNAQNQKDAYLALGYVHAQDRLWQMELVRRLAAARLSEILGKELLSVDQFFSGLGIEEAANGSMLFTSPFGLNLPFLAPSKIIPASAAAPPQA